MGYDADWLRADLRGNGIFALLQEGRHALLDRRNGEHLRLAEVIAANRQQARQGSRRWHPLQPLDVRLVGPPASRRALAEDPQRSAVVPLLQLSQVGGVAVPCIPVRVEPGKVRFQRTLADAEDVPAFAAEDVADHLAV